MTNYEIIKNMSLEEMACFLANETFRMAEPVFDFIGCGIEMQYFFVIKKQWLEEEVSE